MPIHPNTFLNARPLDPDQNYRAYADIVMTDPAGTVSTPTFRCLVDTGSDYTILPLAAATAVGIVPAGAPVTVRSVGGEVYTLPSDPAVRLVVEGKPIVVRVAFSTAAGFIPILGRVELVTAFDAGIDVTNWYWG